MKARIIVVMAALGYAPALAQEPPADIDSEIKAYLEITRSSRVLLKEGDWRLTTSASVSFLGRDFGVGSSSATEFGGAASIAYGLARGLEVFGTIPVGYTGLQQTFFDSNTSSNKGGLGAISVGGRYMLLHEDNRWPEMTASLQFGLPTASTGKPETSARAGLDFVSTIDPIILVGGIGLTYGFDSGTPQIDLTAGMVFGISDRVALGAEVEWRSDPRNFGDPLRDAISFTTRLSVASGRSVFEPFVSIGLTGAAPDVVLGLTWARRF